MTAFSTAYEGIRAVHEAREKAKTNPTLNEAHQIIHTDDFAQKQKQTRRRRHLKNPAPPLSSSAVQWRAVPEKLRRPIGNRWTLIKRTQSGTGLLLPVRPGLRRVPLAPVVVCAAARVLRAAQAAITTLPPLGYWRAQHAACSGALAREGRTTNTELGGRALRQSNKKARWAGFSVGGGRVV